MITNLSITTPVIGSIRLGETVEHGGKRIPKRNNHFTITSLFKHEGEWVPHPMQNEVANATGQDPEKITEIPIRLMFNNPALNMRARYEAYTEGGDIICAGNGKGAKRRVNGQIESVDCPGARNCAFGREKRCDLFARLNVQIEGQDDEFASFILRTESINAVKSLWAKMTGMAAFFGNRLVGIPFALKLRQATTKKSYWSRFFYSDLVLYKVNKFEAIKLACDYEAAMEQAGLKQAEYEQTVQTGLDNGPFEDSGEDIQDLEEFLLSRDLEVDLESDEDKPAEYSDNADPQSQSNKMNGLRDFLDAVSTIPDLHIPGQVSNEATATA